ncbi:MAG TPA: hypothetical protein PL063_06380 [Candidatus Cloacimonadota bacterium]|nr:hypothetical protein [Candidatus Cloacimonadota bacterium]HQB41371.1 hypothetical protein [Candidatus Cloacimonadota bacterium]
MRYNRFFVWLVIVLLLINIFVFLAFKFFNAANFIKLRINDIIENTIDAKVTMGEFSINERQLFISQLKLEDNKGKYNIKIKQVYADYNLFFVLFSKFTKAKPIKDLRIISPELSFVMSESTDKDFEISEISNWFEKLKLEEGIVKLQIQRPDIKMSTEIDSINIEINNAKQSKISIQAHSSNHTDIDINAIFSKKKMLSVKGDISNLKIKNLIINEILKTDLTTSMFLEHDANRTAFNILLNEAKIDLQDQKIQEMLSIEQVLPSGLRINGDQDKAIFTARFDTDSDLTTEISGEVLSPFKKRQTHLNYKINNLQLPATIGVTGKVDAEGSLDCNLNNIIKNYAKDQIKIKSTITSDSLQYQGENVKDIVLIVKTEDLFNKAISFESNEVTALNGKAKISGEYNLKNQSLKSNVTANNVAYQIDNLSLKGSIKSSIKYEKQKYYAENTLENVELKYKDYELNQVYGTFNTSKGQYDIDIFNQDKSLILDYKCNIAKNDHHLIADFKNFHLQNNNETIKKMPISGKIKVDFANDAFDSKIKINIPKHAAYAFYGELDATINADLKKEEAELVCKVQNAYYNLHPITFDLKAKGNLDSLKTTSFKINNTIQTTLTAGIKPHFFYKIESQNQKIPLANITQYFIDLDINQKLKGNLNIARLSYDSTIDNSIYADLTIEGMQFAESNKLDIKTILQGNPDQVLVKSFDIYSGIKKVFNTSGYINDFGAEAKFDAVLNCELNDLILLPDSYADLNGNFSFNYSNNTPTFTAKFNAEKLMLYNQNLNSLSFNIEQKDKEFVVNQFSLGPNLYYNIQGQGTLNFNMILDRAYDSAANLRLDITMDPLGYLSKDLDIVDEVQSKLAGYAQLSMNDEGLVIESAELNMSGGKLKLQQQPQLIDRINFHAQIINNRLNIESFNFRMGKGNISIRNEIKNNEEDFVIGNVNLGHLYLKSEGDGLLIHIPSFSPKNTVANIKLTGRTGSEFEVKGPFDDIHLTGDIEFSNGSGIYPTDSENLLQYLNLIVAKNDDKKRKSSYNRAERRRASSSSDYPFTLDLVLRFKNNMRYVTYPLDLVVNPDSYMELTYKNGRWGVNSGSFISESGEAEIFGTIFQADYVSVIITPFDYYPIIMGSFYKKAPDGTTIYLEISSDPAIDNYLESFTVSLKSDNLDDTNVFQMLSKLRYGKSLDELSEQGEQSILQDEALQLFGVGLGSAFINPYITPLETNFRKRLKLDSFNINPGFVQNLFNEYKSTNQAKMKGQDKDILSFSSSIFLNNLSVNFGKYISKDLFFNYEAVFQEETDIFENNSLYMYNNFSLRYDLPMKIQGIYEFKLMPNNKNEEHQIFFMRTWKF